MLEDRQTEKASCKRSFRGAYMALDEGYGFSRPRTGPKSFTEYSFNAILVMVGLVGSFLATLGAASIYMFFFGLLPIWPFFELPMISGVVGLLTIPLGLLQLFYAWKLHTENFSDFQRVILISWLIIVLSILAAVLSGFMIFFTLQLVLGQVLLNVIVVFFLGKREVQEEFIWESGGNE